MAVAESVVDQRPAGFDSALFGEVLAHATAAFEQAEIWTEPFCHFYAENVLPEDFFRALIAAFPDASHYEPLNLKVWVRENGESTRDRFVFSDDKIAPLPEAQRRLWATLKAVLDSEELKSIAFRNLAKDVAARFSIAPEDVNTIAAFPRTVLFRDTEAYAIKPHPDGTARIVTMMLYLPPDLSQEDLGTSIYVKQPFYKWLSGQRFREVKRFPYRPNSLSAFAVNRMGARTSWHGVEQIGPDRGVRNSLLTQYRTDPG